ncbi:MAG: tetratricopeptide repeat protein [Desulfobacteraceae bacterium]|nr:tetratricopeptide repeat protein [Desulfobacteraceae bacterium]
MSDTTARATELLAKLMKYQSIKYVTVPISWIFKPITYLILRIPSLKVIRIYYDIKELERKEKFEEAENMRMEGLNTIPFRHTGPLLFSQGNDLLYRRKEYRKALEAFENAIEIGIYPLVDPVQIYYGASSAALLTGNHMKAKKYYNEILKWIDFYKSEPKLKSYFETYYENHEGIRWLEQNIQIHI